MLDCVALRGLLRCGLCGKPLYGQLPTDTRSRATYGCKEGHLNISAGLLEQRLIQEIIARAYRAGQSQHQQYRPPRAAEWQGNQRLNRISEQMAELREAYRQDKISGANYIADLDAFE